MRYVILERSPFPGTWRPLDPCFLQAAEHRLGFSRLHYYERALPVGDLLLYELEDAQRIMDYIHEWLPMVELQLYGYWMTA